MMWTEKLPEHCRLVSASTTLTTLFYIVPSQVWADVTDLTFEYRKYGPVHIDVKFADGEHGDGDPFDGIGGTLAHAFFPVYGGEMSEIFLSHSVQLFSSCMSETF